MTRGKWVALTVGLAVIAVIVLNGPAFWKAVAYEQREAEAVFFGTGRARFSRSGGVGGPGDNPFWEDRGFVVVRKRYSWIPGSEFTVPDQMCPACILEFHDACFPKAGGSAGCSFPDGSSVDLSSSFRCTCPDLSHAQESE